jgi:hypothetical protein
LKRFYSIVKSPRLWGLTGTAFVLYFLVFVVLGKLDMSWIMPSTDEIARTIIAIWPRLPFFEAEKGTMTVKGDTNEVIYYTVPTRQFTPQELAHMGVTNSIEHPVAPK